MGKQGSQVDVEIKFDQSKLKIVPIDEVRPNTWNPKQKDHKDLQNIVDSITNYGFRQPIRVRSNDGYEVIDGEQRLQAAHIKKMKKVLIYDEGVVSDEDAKNDTLWWEVHVPFDEIPLANLVTELAGLNMELPYTTEQIDEFKAMAGFNFDEYADERPEDEDPDIKTLNIKLNGEQFKIVTQALERVKAELDCGDARALELISADYLAGAGGAPDGS